jgi:hypothetical protein
MVRSADHLAARPEPAISKLFARRLATVGRRSVSDLTHLRRMGKPASHRHTPTPTHGRFATLVPNEQVVEVLEFETADSALQATITITTTLRT